MVNWGIWVIGKDTRLVLAVYTPSKMVYGVVRPQTLSRRVLTRWIFSSIPPSDRCAVSLDRNVIFHPFNQEDTTTKQTVMTQKRYLKTLTTLSLGSGQYALSGGEDEDLHLWDISGLPTDRPKPVSKVEGHTGEISRLVSLGGIRGEGWVAVSTSLDGSIRRWTAPGEYTNHIHGVSM